jgi:hypothetical protein
MERYIKLKNLIGIIQLILSKTGMCNEIILRTNQRTQIKAHGKHDYVLESRDHQLGPKKGPWAMGLCTEISNPNASTLNSITTLYNILRVINILYRA